MKLLEKLAHMGVVRRAKKRGLIESEEDLLDESVLERVVESEQERLDEKGEASLWNCLYMLPSSIILAGYSIATTTRKYIGERFVPFEPEHTDWVWTGKFYAPVHHDAVPEHYESIYDYTMQHPEYLALAIAIPVAIAAGVYARNKWYDFCRDYITEENIRSAVEERAS